MSDPLAATGGQFVKPAPKRLAFFERYLTLWVLLCMGVGVAFGKLLPEVTASLSKLEFGQGSQVNVPIGVLLWLSNRTGRSGLRDGFCRNSIP